MITDIILKEVPDSRGNPTIESEVFSEKNSARAAAPSGASVGAYEVRAFPEKGVERAVSLFNSEYKSKLVGLEADYHVIDSILKDLDPNREKLGGNLSIAISLATAKLQAAELNKEFYELFAKEVILPYPIGNVIGGGAHSREGAPDIQEFLAIPVGAKTFKDAAFANSKVHELAGKKLSKKYPDFDGNKGDEGAWAPLIGNENALELLSEACTEVGNEINFEIRLALDVAASEFWDSKKGKYVYKGTERTIEEQIDYIAGLIEQFNLYYVEDPLEENDFEGFSKLTEKVGNQCLIVGDDLITTNPERLEKSSQLNSINSLIIKPNQIGSLSDTEKVINMAKSKEYTPVISHRSGETLDTSIAHLAVGFSIPIIKTGIFGKERIAKAKELIRIEVKEENSRMANLKLK